MTTQEWLNYYKRECEQCKGECLVLPGCSACSINRDREATKSVGLLKQPKIVAFDMKLS